MAQSLKSQYGLEVPTRIGEMLKEAWPRFDGVGFLAAASEGYEALELMDRGRHIAHVLRPFLPERYEDAIAVLLSSVGAPLDDTHSFGMGPFMYLPHTLFVAEYGCEERLLGASFRAQYELTQRFTSEFSIRAFIERFPTQTLAQLEAWTEDESEHVRRLVSEGTRPRLPWASRLPVFQADPGPIVALLERLKDDPSRYVQRSVANNLNDIGKDSPKVLYATCRKWSRRASEGRQWIVRHALRSAIKDGEAEALELLGYGDDEGLAIEGAKVSPRSLMVGERVTLRFEVVNTTSQLKRVMVDARVHYVKSNGEARPKVFKVGRCELAPGARQAFEKRISLAQMSTRRHYAGVHEVDAQLNGQPRPIGRFELVQG